jgi:hypothetical protein
MEFVTFNGVNYFLQYHLARQFEPSSFVLDRQPESGELEAEFIRGATGPEGITCKVSAYYGFKPRLNVMTLPEGEVAGFDFNYMRAFSEIMVRRRKLQVIAPHKRLETVLAEVAGDHLEFSKFMKPEVSVLVENERLFSEGETERLAEEALRTGVPSGIELHVVSDGRKAYVRRV